MADKLTIDSRPPQEILDILSSVDELRKLAAGGYSLGDALFQDFERRKNTMRPLNEKYKARKKTMGLSEQIWEYSGKSLNAIKNVIEPFAGVKNKEKTDKGLTFNFKNKGLSWVEVLPKRKGMKVRRFKDIFYRNSNARNRRRTLIPIPKYMKGSLKEEMLTALEKRFYDLMMIRIK
jgi:hypothetical protein